MHLSVANCTHFLREVIGSVSEPPDDDAQESAVHPHESQPQSVVLGPLSNQSPMETNSPKIMDGREFFFSDCRYAWVTCGTCFAFLLVQVQWDCLSMRFDPLVYP
jgi:hypothetical protein